jgi:hypothetical protein
LLAYASGGLYDWSSAQKISLTTSELDDHHIYPRAYITGRPELDIDNDEAEQLVDCVANRTLIPKRLNIRIGKRAPNDYLNEIRQERNPKLASCLESHLIPPDILSDRTWDGAFGVFIEERAKQIYALIERYAITPLNDMNHLHGAPSDLVLDDDERSNGKEQLPDLIRDGRIQIGDLVYVSGHPDKPATIAGGMVVEYAGQRIAINAWGQQITGWPSINIYASIFLERTGQPLGALRRSADAVGTPLEG